MVQVWGTYGRGTYEVLMIQVWLCTLKNSAHTVHYILMYLVWGNILNLCELLYDKMHICTYMYCIFRFTYLYLTYSPDNWNICNGFINIINSWQDGLPKILVFIAKNVCIKSPEAVHFPVPLRVVAYSSVGFEVPFFLIVFHFHHLVIGLYFEAF